MTSRRVSLRSTTAIYHWFVRLWESPHAIVAILLLTTVGVAIVAVATI